MDCCLLLTASALRRPLQASEAVSGTPVCPPASDTITRLHDSIRRAHALPRRRAHRPIQDLSDASPNRPQRSFARSSVPIALNAFDALKPANLNPMNAKRSSQQTLTSGGPYDPKDRRATAAFWALAIRHVGTLGWRAAYGQPTTAAEDRDDEIESPADEGSHHRLSV